MTRSVDRGITWTDSAPLNNNADSDNARDSLPRVATDGLGHWVTVWRSTEDLDGIGTDGDILAATSSDFGATWDAPVSVNTNASTDTGNDSRPDLTTDGDGHWVAVWSSKEALGGTIGPDPDILVARSADDGRSWTDPASLNSNAGAPSALEDQDIRPRIAADGAGLWIVVWDSREDIDGSGTDWDILLARSTDNGATWSDPVAVNPSAHADGVTDSFAAIATDGRGTWLIAWQRHASGGFENGATIMVVRSTDDGLTWSDSTTLISRGRNQTPELTTDRQGNWMVVWNSDADAEGAGTDWDILYSRSLDNALSWTLPQPLSSLASSDSADDGLFGQIVTDRAGNWVAVWRSNSALGPPPSVLGPIGTDFDILTARFALFPDCNGNGVPDQCDTDCGANTGPCNVPQCGETPDCDENGVPDTCEPDFDGDGAIDACDSDIDDDAVLNDQDDCDFTPAGTEVDLWGRPLGDVDRDCDTDLADYRSLQNGFTGPMSPQ